MQRQTAQARVKVNTAGYADQREGKGRRALNLCWLNLNSLRILKVLLDPEDTKKICSIHKS
ncbi:MAG: hypothetical protein FWG30_06400 [Eubacteriaceae bacterium]|nr:hypothetical protein [Eubacteriaceae bacterium]